MFVSTRLNNSFPSSPQQKKAADSLHFSADLGFLLLGGCSIMAVASATNAQQKKCEQEKGELRQQYQAQINQLNQQYQYQLSQLARANMITSPPPHFLQ